MKSKVKTFFAVAGVLVVIVAVSIITTSREPLHGQAGNDSWVPNMIGRWSTQGVGYVFEDVLSADPNLEPVYVEGDLDDFVITRQIGRVFAGTWYDDPNDPGDLKTLVGVILPDRTVSIQDFEPSEERTFITRRLTKSGGTLQIS